MSAYVAKPYVAGSKEAEVIGQTMLSFADNMDADVIEPILARYDMTDIDPEAWYPHQVWMDILKAMDESLGGRASPAFVAFGKQVVQNAVMPPEIQSIPDALNALHAIHHANLRNIPEEEGYTIEQVKDRHYIVYHNTPNPDDAIFGFLWALAARYKKSTETFRVRQIKNEKPNIARSAFEVTWG
jgi:hypothetical protein